MNGTNGTTGTTFPQRLSQTNSLYTEERAISMGLPVREVAPGGPGGPAHPTSGRRIDPANRPSRPDNPRACERPVTSLRGRRPAGPADPQSPGRMSGRSAHPAESPLWARGSGSSRTSAPVLDRRQRRGYAPATDSDPSSAFGCDNRAKREPVRPAQSGKSVRPVGVGEGVGVKTSGVRMGPPLHARKFSTRPHAARSLPTRSPSHE